MSCWRHSVQQGGWPDGTLKPDARVYTVLPTSESKLRLYLTHPRSTWLRAGLRNGDQLVSVNGAAVETEGEFNDLLNALYVGDRVKAAGDTRKRYSDQENDFPNRTPKG